MEIELPDGRTAEFPDEMPMEQIQGVLAKQFPRPQQDPGMLANIAAAANAAAPFGKYATAAAETYLPLPGMTGYGKSYSENLAEQTARNAQVRQQHPFIAGSAEAVGALPWAGLGSLGRTAGLGERLGGNIATGGTIGGLYGAAETPDITDPYKTLQSTSRGTLAGGLASGLLSGAGAYLGREKVPTFSSEDVAALRGRMKEAYKGAEELNAAYSPAAYNNLVDKMVSDAKAEGINPIDHPKASATLDRFQKRAAEAQLTGNPVSLNELEIGRKAINRDIMPESKGEQTFGGLMKSNIDKFIDQPGSAALAAPNIQDAGAAIRYARGLHQQTSKAQALADILQHKEYVAAGSGVGGNVENSTRQAARTFLEKNEYGLTPKEKDLAEKAILGTPTQNLARSIGGLSPRRGMIPLTSELMGAGMGLAAGHPTAALVPMAMGSVGEASRLFANRMEQVATQRLMAQILSGGGRPLQLPYARRMLAPMIAPAVATIPGT